MHVPACVHASPQCHRLLRKEPQVRLHVSCTMCIAQTLAACLAYAGLIRTYHWPLFHCSASAVMHTNLCLSHYTPHGR